MDIEGLNWSLIRDYEGFVMLAHDLYKVQIQLRHTYEGRRKIGLDNYKPLALGELPGQHSLILVDFVPRRIAKERLKSWTQEKWAEIIAEEAKKGYGELELKVIILADDSDPLFEDRWSRPTPTADWRPFTFPIDSRRLHK